MNDELTRTLTDQETVRHNKLAKMTKEGDNPYLVTSVKRTHTCAEFNDAYQNYTREDLEANAAKERVVLVGRIIGLRRTFIVLSDWSGTTQIYIDKNKQPAAFAYLNDYVDLGDLLMASGFVMRTKTDAITLNADKIAIVAKSLRTPPEKWHGLTDVETRARQRYLDLANNRETINLFLLRAKIIANMRSFLNQQGFIEVETPILQSVAGGAAARPFITHHNTLDHDFYLRIALELPLKKLLVGGLEKVYEIGRVFRNEGMDATHNPEFTSLELYWAYADLTAIMNLVEQLVRYLVTQINKAVFRFNQHEIDLSKPFRQVRMVDLVKECCSVDFLQVPDDQTAIKLAKEHHIPVRPHERTWGHILTLFFEHYCEKTLIQPTFVFGYPVDVSPLAKREPSDQRFTQRFEFFVGGKELANAYGELNDPLEQRKRFMQQLSERNAGNNEAEGIDQDFLIALEHGMPPAGGLGIGVDRLIMLLTENNTIRNVLLFPTMRPEK